MTIFDIATLRVFSEKEQRKRNQKEEVLRGFSPEAPCFRTTPASGLEHQRRMVGRLSTRSARPPALSRDMQHLICYMTTLR